MNDDDFGHHRRHGNDDDNHRHGDNDVDHHHGDNYIDHHHVYHIMMMFITS